MSVQLRVILTMIGWTAGVTLVHLGLNSRAFDLAAGQLPADAQFRVGFLPVT